MSGTMRSFSVNFTVCLFGYGSAVVAEILVVYVYDENRDDNH